METKLNVTILAHTPEFEQNIVRGARLCYSSANIEELKDKVTPEDAERFLNMILEIGHGSILEHSSITFGIEGISRSLSHQLVRHRIGCSFSQKSQRYVNETDFNFIVPNPIKNNPIAYESFLDHMKVSQDAYEKLYYILLYGLIDDFYKEKNENPKIYKDLDQKFEAFKSEYKNEYNKLSKIAAENARAVLPNACETKIQVTMNVRALFNFFKERLCDRAQEEIREMAFEMWKACMEISPTIFKYAVPTCVNGKCKEGKMSCGKMLQYKQKYKEIIDNYNK